MLRPTLGIQLAPQAVGALAHFNLISGPSDALAYALVGNALLQLLLLARLGHWILAAGVAVSAWSFSFGLTALATAMLDMVARGYTGPVALLAPAVFTLVCVLLAVLMLRSNVLLVSGRILSQSPTASLYGLAADRQ